MSIPQQHLHSALLDLALRESLHCILSPTAFSVGSVIFLPRTLALRAELDSTRSDPSNTLDELFDVLEPNFPVFRSGGIAEDGPAEESSSYGEQVQGLILSSSYSRAIEGNTHAEANALTLLERKISQLPIEMQKGVLAVTGTTMADDDVTPQAVYQAILSRAWLYATMEPCSRRTSGLRSCTDAILASSLKRVYIVSTGSTIHRAPLMSVTGSTGTTRLRTV
jgi:pyrimidine deaminase RibD-like protein